MDTASEDRSGDEKLKSSGLQDAEAPKTEGRELPFIFWRSEDPERGAARRQPTGPGEELIECHSKRIRCIAPPKRRQRRGGLRMRNELAVPSSRGPIRAPCTAGLAVKDERPEPDQSLLVAELPRCPPRRAPCVPCRPSRSGDAVQPGLRESLSPPSTCGAPRAPPRRSRVWWIRGFRWLLPSDSFCWQRHSMSHRARRCDPTSMIRPLCLRRPSDSQTQTAKLPERGSKRTRGRGRSGPRSRSRRANPSLARRHT
eukprot:scaffold7328_cov314-Pinguiococcus_pyrenoidosus.AAC.83